MATKPIVVGVDGSEESFQAVEWAAIEAKRHGSPLRIVSAPAAMPRVRAYHATESTVAIALRGVSARALDAAVARSEEVAPGLSVTTGLLSGAPALAVAESGSTAAMLVVGARRAGGLAGMVLGSVRKYAAAYAPCPVVVVRQESMAVHREIAVGIGDPQDTTDTLRFAFEEAALRGADLTAVHAWFWFPSRLRAPGDGGDAELRRADPQQISAQATSQLTAALQEWRDKYPDVRVRQERGPRPSGPGTGQLFCPGRPRRARQAWQSQRRGPRHRLDPVRGARSRPRSGGHRFLSAAHGNRFGLDLSPLSFGQGDIVMTKMKTIDDLAVTDRRVLVRADLNVPLDGYDVADDGRIRATLPTLTALMERHAKVVVCAHLGRPKGKPDRRYSLLPVAARLGQLLGRRVELAADTAGPAARAAVAALRPGGLVMLENLRFNEGETSKDDVQRGLFADQLAALADLYVADGFGAVHRKHASVYDVALRLPHAAGYLVQAEVAALSRLTEDIRRPYVVLLGGAKVEDKLDAIDSLITAADRILVGGSMAFPFLVAQGHKVGTSRLEAESGRRRRGVSRSGSPGGQGSRPAGRSHRGTRYFRRIAARSSGRRRDPPGSDGPGHRPGVGPGFRRQHRRGPDGLLERPDGCIRAGPVRRW